MAKRMSRREAIDGVLDAGRVIGAEAVLFHAALSARMGLSPVEEKTLDVLQREGPLTAGELSKHTGLAPPSVTGLINRLEKKGFVRRVADDEDGRRVRVAVVPASAADQLPSTVLPSGESMPRPVTTTRRLLKASTSGWHVAAMTHRAPAAAPGLARQKPQVLDWC